MVFQSSVPHRSLVVFQSLCSILLSAGELSRYGKNMTSPIEKHKQHQALIEKHKQMEIPIKLIKIQNMFNKNNIEKQHEFNLEIFEKQAELTREMQKEQAKLLKKLSWRTVIATILAVIIGALFGLYLERSGLRQPLQPPPKQAKAPNEKQNTPVIPSPGEREKIKETKSTARGESSSNTLKKP